MNKNHLSRCPGVRLCFLGPLSVRQVWTSSVAQRPLFLAACSSRITAGVTCATEGFLFERSRVALSRESTRLMPFPFPETPIACGAMRMKRPTKTSLRFGVAVCHGLSIYCKQEYAPISLLLVFAWIALLRHSPRNRRKGMADFFGVLPIVGGRYEPGSLLFPV